MPPRPFVRRTVQGTVVAKNKAEKADNFFFCAAIQSTANKRVSADFHTHCQRQGEKGHIIRRKNSTKYVVRPHLRYISNTRGATPTIMRLADSHIHSHVFTTPLLCSAPDGS